MLTLSQIQRLAQRHGIGAQAQERDYVQGLLLFQFYSRSQQLVFKGGTALRIVYNGNRFSEDLDFNAGAPLETVKGLWQGAVNGLLNFGMEAEARNEWQSDEGYSFDVSYRGPLYDGRDRTKGKVRVDINLRPEEVETRRELVSPEYDDLRPFVVNVISPSHLLAEKVRALFTRGKPRDAYDIWLLSARGIELNRALLEQKFTPLEIPLTRERLQTSLEKAQADWERDLRPLLSQFVKWEDALAVIAPLLNKLIG
jgi:predicted nucleotidyltransferase component of viral defense system